MGSEMNKCLLQLILIAFTLSVALCNSVSVFNNGPVTFDTPITFTVTVQHYSIAPSYEYRFSFDEFPNQNQNILSSSKLINQSVIFQSSKAVNSDSYTARIDVWYCFFGVPVFSVGIASSTFQLSDSLIGSLKFKQEKLPDKALNNHFVSTEQSTNLTATVYDPSDFLISANFTYKWILNGDPQEETTSSTISYNFTEPQQNNISVIVSASIPTPVQTLQKSGSLNLALTSRIPLHNISADGKTYVHRDENLQLRMDFISGSPPFWYCWTIKNMTAPNGSQPEIMEPICGQTSENYFPITRYFNRKGKYNLTIEGGNDVSSLVKNWAISIYEIEHQAQLSFVVIPVCSILLAIFIIIGGIAIHMRQRKELSIEVADFDFQSYDELVERTFFERIRDNFTQSLKKSFIVPCARRNQYDDLINDQAVNNDEISQPEPTISECNLRFSGDFNDSGVSDVRT